MKRPVYRHLQRFGEGHFVHEFVMLIYPVLRADFHSLLSRISECKITQKEGTLQSFLCFPTPFSDRLGKIQRGLGKRLGKNEMKVGEKYKIL